MLMASFVAPIIVDGKFIGIAGVDLGLDDLNKKSEGVFQRMTEQQT